MKSRMFASFAGTALMGLAITQPVGAAIEFETEGQSGSAAVEMTQGAPACGPLMLLDTQNPNLGGANTSPVTGGGPGPKGNRGPLGLRTASSGMAGMGGGSTNFSGNVNVNKDALPGANVTAGSTGGATGGTGSLTPPLTTNVSLVDDDSSQGSSDIVEECVDHPTDTSGDDGVDSGTDGSESEGGESEGSESETGNGSVDSPDAQAVPEPASMLAWVLLAGMGLGMSFLRR